MTLRIGHRPQIYGITQNDQQVYAPKKGKTSGWASSAKPQRSALSPLTQPAYRQAAKPTGQSALAKRRAETAANKGYGGAFVMLDLTDTEAHALRLDAMAQIKEGHHKTPGGILFPDAYVDASESHISLIRGISAPLLHPSTVASGQEKPAPGHLAAFAALHDRAAPNLSLEPRITYWDGPAVGPAQYRVAALVVNDQAQSLPAMREAWAKAGGTHVPSNMPMHLTLAYLKLDQPSLPKDVEESILKGVRAAKPWQQTSLAYSGRYGAVFGQAKMPAEDKKSGI